MRTQKKENKMISVKDVSTTDELEKTLSRVRPDEIDRYYAEEEARLIQEKRPFMAFMDELIRRCGMTKQALLLKANIPEKYGYRLLEEERHSRKRDVYLRLCFAAGADLNEAQRALRLAGHEKLYARIPRDAAFIVALNEHMDVDAVNELLERYGLEPLAPCGDSE